MKITIAFIRKNELQYMPYKTRKVDC